MKTRLLGLVVLIGLAGGCKHAGGSGFAAVNAPPAAPSAKPMVEAVGSGVEAVDTSNRELGVRVAELRREAAAARTEAGAAVKRAEVLAKAGAATKEELNQAWTDLQSLEARNLFLETETGKMEQTVKRQQTEILDLRKTATEARLAVTAVEQENLGLRSALLETTRRGMFEKDRADRAEEQAGKERGLRETVEKDFAAAKAFRFWTLVTLAVVAAVLLFRIFLPVILKAIKP